MANLLPTPAPSTDIEGKTNVLSAHLDSISLPPAAIRNGRASVSSSSTTDGAADSSYQPISPSSPELRQKPQAEKTHSTSRKRSSEKAELGPILADNYALPPPPTRTRKIIQMKPQNGKGRGQREQQQQQSAAATASQTSPKGSAAAPPAQTQASGQASTTGGKRKQGNASTAAGRKIARKTAHSLIERRRRSKMNEEFGVLKDMIPACAGQEMHKLAILQASIEYMRYLETCVTELKTAHQKCTTADGRDTTMTEPPSYTASTTRTSPQEADLDDDEVSDEDMGDNTNSERHDAPSEYHRDYSAARHSYPSVSPAILPSATTSPLFARSSTSNNQSFSNLSSPAFQGQQQQNLPRLPSLSLTSPMLQAQPNEPHSARGQETIQLPPVASITGAQGQQSLAENDEATASALLMLTTDRRSWTGRGMSVKDLLSSQ